DVDVRMPLLDERDTLRRGNDAHQTNRARARMLNEFERGDRAAAGGKHRVDHQNIAVVERSRKLRVVSRRDGRHLITLKADVTDARVGDKVENGVEHAETGAKYRNHDHVAADTTNLGRAEGRLDGP